MLKLISLTFVFGMGLAPMLQADTGTEQGKITNGLAIPDEGYCDQPYVVITKEGHWLCTLTTGRGHEGQKGQHIVNPI